MRVKEHHQCVFTYCDCSVFATHRIYVYFNQNNFIENDSGIVKKGGIARLIRKMGRKVGSKNPIVAPQPMAESVQ